MMKIKQYWVACLCAVALPLTLMAQEKTFTLQDLIPGGKNYSRFQPKSIRQLQWLGDTYLYAKGDSLLQGILPKGHEQVVLTREGLNGMLQAAGRESVGSLPNFSVVNPSKCHAHERGQLGLLCSQWLFGLYRRTEFAHLVAR